MDSKRTGGKKLLEWLRRYLPCEIAATVAELGGAAVVYLLTGSFALAAVIATGCSSVGYYGAAYVNAVRWSYASRTDGLWLSRLLAANGLALRSMVVEFGPAETIDSLVIRPAAFYLGPVLTGNAVVGLLIGKVVADIAFYACAIFSYEKFHRLVAMRRTEMEETDDEPVDAMPAA